jgi:hypothetical protein
MLVWIEFSRRRTVFAGVGKGAALWMLWIFFNGNSGAHCVPEDTRRIIVVLKILSDCF